jgi:transcriptional regulator with XRE-family HTH domain
MMQGEPVEPVSEKTPEPEVCGNPIARKVQEIERQKTQAVQMAIDIGKHLIKVKSQLKHGEWLPWLQQNFPHSTTSAGHYMRMAQHVDLTKDHPTSIREALQQITDAEEKQPQTRQSLTDAVLHMMKSSRQSRYAISQKSGISQAVLSRFVNGERLLGMRTLERLAEALGHKITLVPEAKEST